MPLSNCETRFVKGMLAWGDRQHDIAAYFGVNGGRIAEVANGTCNYPNAQPMPEDELPPPGPYITQYALQPVIDTLEEAIELIELPGVVGADANIDDIKAALEQYQRTLNHFRDSLEA